MGFTEIICPSSAQAIDSLSAIGSPSASMALVPWNGKQRLFTRQELENLIIAADNFTKEQEKTAPSSLEHSSKLLSTIEAFEMKWNRGGRAHQKNRLVHLWSDPYVESRSNSFSCCNDYDRHSNRYLTTGDDRLTFCFIELYRFLRTFKRNRS